MNPKNGGGGGRTPNMGPPPKKNWGPPQRGNISLPFPPQFLQPFNNPPKKGGDLKLGTPPHLLPNPPTGILWDWEPPPQTGIPQTGISQTGTPWNWDSPKLGAP